MKKLKGYGVYDLTEVKFTVDFYPQAVGFRSTLEEVPDWVKSKKSVSLIINDDDLCLTERQYALPWQSLTLCTAKSNVMYTHIKQPLFRSKLPSLRLGIATPPPGAWRGRKPARKYCIIKTTKKSIGF